MNILVIDDDQRIINLVTRSLKSHHFTVDSALNREEGFSKAKIKKYEVIILDVVLASDDRNGGFELLSQLRAVGVQTPILILSSRTLIADRCQGLDLGADDYLTKNFSTAELAARVKALIRRKPLDSSNILKCGNLVVNLSDLMVERAGKNIQLTKKEFSILVTLLRKKGGLVTRDELIENVWGYNNAVSTNSVDVHIRYLRKAIDEKFDVPMIQTVHGYGYLISANPNTKDKELTKSRNKSENENRGRGRPKKTKK